MRWDRLAGAVLPVAAVLIVLVAYVWVVSLGTWRDWPEAYDYSHYDKLARAFMHGQAYLLEKPDTSLLDLADPYDPTQRADLPYVIDASLFHGRYYFYFGPIPAIMLVIPKLFTSAVIHDVYLLFAMVCALFLVQVLFITRIRRQFFPSVPSLVVACCILLLGLSMPFTWLLGSQATPHNTAIVAGQLFFIAGLWASFEAISKENPHWIRSAGAGILFALAIGSRLTQSLPVALVVVLLAIALVRRQGLAKHSLAVIAGLLTPLILAAAGLGWYNWIRFDSLWETGYSYQLAMVPMQQHLHELFSTRYVVQNLYNYFLNPPRLRYAFPYLWPEMGARTPVMAGIELPSIYFTEENVGFVYIAPMLIFAFLSALRGRARRRDEGPGTEEGSQINWLRSGLALAAVGGLAVFCLFFWASNRYLADFFSPALLLSILGFWELIEASRTRALARTTIIALGLTLIFASLVVSLTLAIAQNAGAYTALDPHISRQLRRLFPP
jgi:hypothetical protein